MQQNPRLEAALSYAGRGWRVFPIHVALAGVCSCKQGPKCPPKSAGKHPRIKQWQVDATTDAKQVARWWQRWPGANVGIATGDASGLFVLDVDGDEGRQALAELVRLHGPLPMTAVGRTARGIHCYFNLVAGTDARNSSGGGLDVRANGGYVLAPPSLHPSGVTYAWAVAP